MGILDSLIGKEREAPLEPSNSPFRVYLGFSPLRLSAMKDNKVNLIVKITNITRDSQIVSLDVSLRNQMLIGFEPTCIHKNHDKKIGDLKSGETKELVIPIYGTNQTKQGDYMVEVTAYSHYLNFDKVLSSVRKRINLRVV